MDFTTEYGFGDKVWTLSRSHKRLELPCRFCRGRQTFRVEGAGGEVSYADCPECKGHAPTVSLVVVPAWAASERPLTVRQIRIEATDPSIDADWLHDREYREESYMCEETGVGTGNIHRPRDLFRSLAEAQEEAERRTEAREGWKPSYNDVRVAQGFLDHRDVYEHTEEHIEIAEQIVAAAEAGSFS